MTANPESAHPSHSQPALVAAPDISRRKRYDVLLVTLFLAVEVAWIGGLGMLAAWLLFS